MIKVAKNNLRDMLADTSGYSYENTREVRAIHKSLGVYRETPLYSLNNFAATKNLRAVLVKDESDRFGLKAFKGLGGIYAMYEVIVKHLGVKHISLSELQNYRKEISEMVFVTTTDGNHGKGVSWAAGIFGCKSYVFMPHGTVEVRAQAIRDAGDAEVKITDLVYDDCVRYTAELAEKNHWNLIQDTSWGGYEEIPELIMRGYTTIFYESVEQMRKFGYPKPTHIFLQAGVGSMAGAICACVGENFRDNLPRISIVEPLEVACFYETMKFNDGEIHTATGSGETIMAGLNCATPCGIAWRFIKSYAADSVAIPDSATMAAMRQLGVGVNGDPKIVAGESGAAGFALANLLDDKKIRVALEIDDTSVIFVINTEGATDPQNYDRIMNS